MKSISDDGRYNFNTCVAMAVLSTVAVGLRLTTRKSWKQRLNTAEWLCLLALCLFLGYTSVMIHYIFADSVRGDFIIQDFQSPAEIVPLMKMIYAVQNLFGLTITAVKISILFFYYDIFHINKTFRRAIQLTGLLCVLWCLISTPIIIFKCSPIHAFWDRNFDGVAPHCIHAAKLYLGLEISNLLIDLVIIGLPILVIRTLQLARLRKAMVASIFILSGFVCFASIMRIRYIWNPPNLDQNFDIPRTMLWSTIQLGVALICSCLPTYAPLFRVNLIIRTIERIQIFFFPNKRKSVPSTGGSGSGAKPGQAYKKSSWQQIDEGRSPSAWKVTVRQDIDMEMTPVSSKSHLAKHGVNTEAFYQHDV